ncbi:hypothetical protein H0H87_002604 [Tephrocybe sp. NHM501043]|nr:hypothetical protein H0H87_002604 [Tephrocybe sp. NHM501043]
MPPKRKASSSLLNESPAKRSARSSEKQAVTPLKSVPTAVRATHSSTALSVPVLTTRNAQTRAQDAPQKGTFQSVQTPRKLPTGKRTAENSPSKKAKTPRNPSTFTATPEVCQPSHELKRVTRSSGPLKFDSIVIPTTPTPRRTRPRRRAVSLISVPETVASAQESESGEPPSDNPFISVDASDPIPVESELFDRPSSSSPPPPVSPTKTRGFVVGEFVLASPTRVSKTLPTHLHACLNAQKRAILWAAQHPPVDSNEDIDEDPATNTVAAQQLTSLLSGTLTRGEGNSCLVLGPRGSGKTRLVKNCIRSFVEEKPIVIRLSGWTQHSDRLAMREIAYQLHQQTGTSYLSQGDDDGDAEADSEGSHPLFESLSSSKPPAGQLPALISLLPALSRPTIVVLDAFDLFILHPRQALLYCLLDTAQSCRAGAGNKGLAVIGITSRIDTIVHLEKRVKSRFSGRMIRTAPPRTLEDWETIIKAILFKEVDTFMDTHPLEEEVVAEWSAVWSAVVEKFLQDSSVLAVWNDTFSVTRDVRMLTRMLAFEDLITIQVFVPTTAYVPSVAREFIKYRSVVEREDVKKAVDKMGQVNLKKWLAKAG